MNISSDMVHSHNIYNIQNIHNNYVSQQQIINVMDILDC